MDTLTNEFVVKRPIDEAWLLLTDIERIAPCLPGAELTEIDGDVYKGVVKVKLGPITTAFKGQATFVERDDANHTATIHGEGRDTTGKGNAEAVIVASLHAESDATTTVKVSSDIKFTGKVAQFGRLGVVRDTSEKLMGQFAHNLDRMLAEQPRQPGEEPRPAPAQAEAIDLADVVPGAALLTKIVPFLGGLALLLLILKRLRRRS
jgi:hypothetical protein